MPFLGCSNCYICWNIWQPLGAPTLLYGRWQRRQHRWAELQIKVNKTFPYYLESTRWFSWTTFFRWPLKMNNLLFLPLGLLSSKLSVCGNDIHDLIARYQDASDYGIILNCGRQAVTAICLCSHILLAFRLIEIKILIRTISQCMEINRGIKVVLPFVFKPHTQFCQQTSTHTPWLFYFLASIYKC